MSSVTKISIPVAEPEVLLKVENVGKIFCRDLKKSLLYGLKDSIRDLVGVSKSESSGKRQLRKDEFWANQGVSFELRRGECLGMIGHNGAGKTTLLKMLNGLIKPDTGRIEMHGRLGALIALGAGFNPILTGRENIYVSGSVLGLTKKEIDARIDEIIDFAGIEDFINSPVQNYSSGMQVRLGFAVASSMNPDILILDEVLAVGDEEFQLKCFTRIGELISGEVAVILVTHQMQNVARICNRAILLDNGAISADSKNVANIISKYQSLSARENEFGDTHKVFYNEQFNIKLNKIEISNSNSILLALQNNSAKSFDFMVSYSLYSNNFELGRGFDKEKSFRLESLNNCTFEILCPISEFDINNLTLNISLWQKGISQPLLWVKGIEIAHATANKKSLIETK
jgi:lipopolysaccharide transport system ATP-binding protein